MSRKEQLLRDIMKQALEVYEMAVARAFVDSQKHPYVTTQQILDSVAVLTQLAARLKCLDKPLED